MKPTADTAEPAARTAPALSAREAVAWWRPANAFEAACVVVTALAVAARLPGFGVRGATWDVGWYLTMAESLLRYGEFIIPWVGADAFTHHYPPLFPALLAAGISVTGAHAFTLHATAFLVTVLLVGVTFFTTRDLFGRERAFAATALVAAFPILVPLDTMGFTESLVVAFYALTIWGILKSLTREWFIVPAGVFAALGYLTKASMGSFVLLAGAAGFAWRFAFMRWRLFRNVPYMVAGAIAVTGVGAWAARNVARHGWPNWHTQEHARGAFEHMWTVPEWPVALGGQLLWSALMLAAFALPLAHGARRVLPRWREEATSGLLLAIVTPSVIAVFFVTAFHLYENTEATRTTLNARYLVAALVPLVWLGLRDLDLSPQVLPDGAPQAGAARARRQRVLAAAGVGVLALAFALDPTAERLTMTRVLVLYATVLAGIALLAASMWHHVRVRTRRSGTGARASSTWRFESARLPAGAVFAVAGFTIAGFVVSTFWALLLLPFFAAAAAAAALPHARWKVAAAAIILLGASLAGAGLVGQEAVVARDLAAAAPEGATVAVIDGREHFLWPFLPESFTMVRPDAEPEFLVHIQPPAGEPVDAAPEGYVEWKTYAWDTVRSPGTIASNALAELVTGEGASEVAGASAVVYRRA